VTADPILTLAWLALAHLVADFVIQSNRVATEKFGFGRRAWQALGMHWLGAAVCLLPFVVAFGAPGVLVVLAVSVAHAVIDRVKIVWTMRVEARAVAEARAIREGPAPAASLGTAWTPMPAFLFLLDQAAHVVVTLLAWAVLLASAPVTDGFAAAVRGVLGAADQATAHRVVLTAVVLLDLLIINVRAASLFVATLVHPREQVTGVEEPVAARQPAVTITDELVLVAGSAAGEDRDVVRASLVEVAPAPPPAPRPSVASPARVGATIGVLERLLIVGFVLTNATTAVGFVVAAKTLARFKQLDDRQFAEYYLLGTLASVAVALGSAFVAAAALRP
jgi:hypothetical protein